MRPQDLIGPNVYWQLTEMMGARSELVTYKMRQQDEGGGIEFFMDEAVCERVLSTNDDVWNHSQTYAGLLAVTRWLSDGPKMFLAKEHECLAMEAVDLNIDQADYQQPYPCIAVVFPRGMYDPFLGCLAFANDDILIGFLSAERCPVSAFVVRSYAKAVRMESMIHTFGENVRQWQEPGSKAFRVGFNLCLALANFGCQAEILFKKDFERDQRLAGERSDRGARARRRVALAAQRLCFNQEVRLHKDERPAGGGEPLGGSVTTHWRRGHWAMQPFGEKQSQRKRIFRKPVLVRADLFTGDMTKSSTTYRT